MDLSGLRCLQLYFERVGFSSDSDPDHLIQLPNLEEFHIDQLFYGRSDDNQNLDKMTSVPELLDNVRNWHRLRRLDLRCLVTTVEDSKAFMGPHAAAGTLETFEIRAGLISAKLKADEKQKRVDLPH